MVRFLASVVPAGEAATCDYVGATASRGFPSGPTQGLLAQAIAKAGLNMTAEQYLAKISSLRRQVSSAILVTVEGVGEIGEGDYYQVAQLKIKPGVAAAWRQLESKTWRPVQEERVKAGKLKGWRIYSRMLPGGSGHPYGALAINAYPSWSAQGQPAGLTDAVKKVHPNLKQEEFGEKTTAARDLVNSEVRQAILVIGKEDVAGAPGGKLTDESTHYLTELQRSEETAQNPSEWMPWNYRETLPRAGTSEDSGQASTPET